MPEPYSIALETDPDPGEIKQVRAGLSAYNYTFSGDDSYTPLTLLLKSREGKIMGGLLGGTYWGWLYVEVLWVAEGLRGQGLGGKLLDRAEEAARERGCFAAHLDTMDFQAPDFYLKRGYTVYGVLDDLPRGHQRFFLKKVFNPNGPA
jgi:GNAT superfamily N-acetyltransferase